MPFTLPTFAQILQRSRSDFGGFADGTTPPESVEYVLSAIQARLSYGLYGYLSYIMRQAFPDTAEDAYFWHWASVFGLTQKSAVTWKGYIDFTGSADGTSIPAGTQVQRGDGALYTTDTTVTIASGAATAAATASVGGIASNLAVSDPLAIGVPIYGVDTDCVVSSVTRNGSDEETVSDAKARLLQTLATPPSGGGPGDYVRWALQVSGVTRAWEFANLEAPNSVSVACVRDGDGSGAAIVPDGTERAAVLSHLQSVAPITVDVRVITLTAVAVPITITGLSPDTADVRAAIAESLADLFEREAQPSATLLRSHIDEAISGAAGESDHTLTIPAADVVSAVNEMPYLGAITYA
jgi:uncharacterized phage protein gp47/JayE